MTGAENCVLLSWRVVLWLGDNCAWAFLGDAVQAYTESEAIANARRQAIAQWPERASALNTCVASAYVRESERFDPSRVGTR
jgi:hypothetical protein